ncbi:MAG: MBL fold metallo-hydrolase [Bacteroidales bacterium]|nr:MBL fold metallo-hydrolase [Bacteroidales bacterium]
MQLKPLLPAFALALLAACAAPKDVEVGPYTVSVIEKNVYHIQDYNSENPAGESFDAEGNKTHFNNCSDIYLFVGKNEALLLDLSNPITWADNAAESLRDIVWERAGGMPLTITFTHNHGDHTGMLPAFVNDPGVQFALPQIDFARLADRFPEERTRFFDEGEIFDLGGLKLEAIGVPGHTDGSMVYLLQGRDLLFSGDAVAGAHGVWLFNANAFNQYVSGVPYLIRTLEERGVNEKRLKIYGGHYWQKDWLNLPKGTELGMQYLRDMKALCDEIESGTAATEPSNLGRPGLETYFRHGDAIITWSAEQAEQFRQRYSEKFAYRDADVVFRQIDEHTWEGNGYQVYNESVYLVEGEEKALLIDAGAYMPHLDQAVAALTDKPVMVALTHGHGDHVGGIVCFPEVWIHPADIPMIARNGEGYQGEIHELNDGDVIDLGGREIEVLHTPGHTSGSITFFDKERHYGFSGDAFGSTNLLLFVPSFSTLIETCTRTADYMQKNGIKKLFPGHYGGPNVETLQRVLDEKKMSQELLAGKRQGVAENANGLNRYIRDYGVTIRYTDPDALK